MEVLMAVIGGGAITGVLSLAGTVYTSKRQHDATLTAVQTNIDAIKCDIARLEKKQDKYNTLQERTARCEEQLKTLFASQKGGHT